MKTLVLLALVGACSAVILEREPFVRLIPADILRDFQKQCFASTKCKVYPPGEGWSLSPFCGASRCVKLKSGRLAEEVTDCGPVLDIKNSEGCRILKDASDPKAEYPDCCPVYDCDEGVEPVYVNAPKKSEEWRKKKRRQIELHTESRNLNKIPT